MATHKTKIAVNHGGGYIPGLNAVLLGVARAGRSLGWEIVGIRDGFDGLLFPERYGNEGIVKLELATLETVSASGVPMLGAGTHADPFHVRTVTGENLVEETDRSAELLKLIEKQGITAVISVVGLRPMSVLFRLHQKGMISVCVPASVENDVAATQLSFGFNTTLSATLQLLDNARSAAQASRKLGVVEALGEHTGWLALQAGVAAGADAVLIPEIPYDIQKVAAKVRERVAAGESHALVVVAEGAQPAQKSGQEAGGGEPHALRASLSPLATGEEGSHVIHRSGLAAETLAHELQRLTDQQTYPLVLGQLVKGGAPTAVDRQLGIGYGAAAVRAIQEKQNGVVVSFQPPKLQFVPLRDAINRIRTIPANSLFVQTARSLGICLGD